jgi:predicted PurR-regulated permease PerM
MSVPSGPLTASPNTSDRLAGQVNSSSNRESEPVLPQLPVDVRNVALSLIALAVAIVLVRYMQDVLIPFVLGGLLFYALDPAVDWLQRCRVPRVAGAAVALGVFIAGAGSLTYTLQGQALTVIDRLPEGARKLRDVVRGPSTAAPGPLAKVNQAAQELQSGPSSGPTPIFDDVVRVQVEAPPFRASDYFWSGSMSALSFVNQIVMILFLTYFMLLSDDLYKRKLVEVVGPTLTKKKVTVQILEEIATQIERFLLIQVFTSTIVAVATGVALWAMGLQQAAIWGLLAGIFNSIPYYGPLLVTAGLSVVAFLQFGTLGMTLAVAGVSILITTLEGSLLTPTLMGHVAQMNSVAVFAGLLFWSWMWGAWGLLLAVPIMMVVKTVCDRIEDLEPIGRFLGE